MAYEAKNKEVKEKIIASKQLHDQIMNKFIASTIVCQVIIIIFFIINLK